MSIYPPTFPFSLLSACVLVLSSIYPVTLSSSSFSRQSSSHLFIQLSTQPSWLFHPSTQFPILSSIHLCSQHLLSSYEVQSISLINIFKLMAINNYCQKNIFRIILLPPSSKVFIIQTYRLIQEMC